MPSENEFVYKALDASTFWAESKEGKEIGTLELAEREQDGLTYILNIDVKPEYQRKGIGSQLVKNAMDATGGDLLFPNFDRTSASEDNDFFLSDEGVSLMLSCLRKGIITKENVAKGSADCCFNDNDSSKDSDDEHNCPRNAWNDDASLEVTLGDSNSVNTALLGYGLHREDSSNKSDEGDKTNSTASTSNSSTP